MSSYMPPITDEMRIQLQAQQAGLIPDYSEMPQEKPEAKFLEQLDPTDICTEIEGMLRGKYLDKTTKQWNDIPGISKKITDEGVAEIMLRIRHLVNTSSVYSELDDDIIINIIIGNGKELARYLQLNYKKFNMDVIDINKLPLIACDMAYINLKRGHDALTLRMMKTVVQQRELSSTQMGGSGDKKKSWLDPLGIFGKKQ